MSWRFRWNQAGRLFRIERGRPGLYLNSPRVWSVCGCIRARDRGEATMKACFAVGSSVVRVIPLGDAE